jgi:hypothetical protein
MPAQAAGCSLDMRSAPIVLVASALALAGCSKTYIPNTDVEDSSFNRKVVSFCEEYRHAVEEKNVPKLLSMASPLYHEDGGTPAGDDDMDYEGLKEYLTALFTKASDIRYEMRYRRISIADNQHVYVDYTYSASYKMPGIAGDEWKHKVEENRLDLVVDGDSFKIVAGM